MPNRRDMDVQWLRRKHQIIIDDFNQSDDQQAESAHVTFIPGDDGPSSKNDKVTMPDLLRSSSVDSRG